MIRLRPRHHAKPLNRNAAHQLQARRSCDRRLGQGRGQPRPNRSSRSPRTLMCIHASQPREELARRNCVWPTDSPLLLQGRLDRNQVQGAGPRSLPAANTWQRRQRRKRRTDRQPRRLRRGDGLWFRICRERHAGHVSSVGQKLHATRRDGCGICDRPDASDLTRRRRRQRHLPSRRTNQIACMLAAPTLRATRAARMA